MSDPFGGYKYGQRVLFIDENQCEIKGVIENMESNENYLLLFIRQDDNSIYRAMLERTQPAR